MCNRKVRVQENWSIGFLIILCLIFFSAQGILAQEYGLGDIPLDPEVYQMHLKVAPDRAIESLPTAYDARNEGIVTSAKNQGNCGSCWAFASVGAMESHMLKAFGFGPTDLSEQQQVSCNTSMWGCDGGNSSAIRYWETKGPLYEEYFPYTANDSTACVEDPSEQLGYRVTNWHTVSATPSGFNTSLYSNGPSYWRFTVYSDFFTYWNSGSPGQVYVNTGGTLAGGHAVLLIGWDDTKGAYLCKNSWGTYSGPNDDGTFWIAYSGHYNNLGFGMANFSLARISECGNSICEPGEDQCSCPEDCGYPSVFEDDNTCFDGLDNDCDGCLDEMDSDCGGTEGSCSNSLDDNCDGLADCDDPDCSGDPVCICNDNGACDGDEDCYICPDECIGGDGTGCNNNGVCEPNKLEDCHTCPSDCSGMLTGKPGGRYCCGENLACSDSRCNNCSIDVPVPYCCGDGTCGGEEDEINCAIDCSFICTRDEDCDDSNECTNDACANTVCEYTFKVDTPCAGGICCNGECSPPVCSEDEDCVDTVTCTADTCMNAGTCNAKCENNWPTCGEGDGCCGPDCSSENDPDCLSPDQDCSECLGGVCDGKCHPVKEGSTSCPDCELFNDKKDLNRVNDPSRI